MADAEVGPPAAQPAAAGPATTTISTISLQSGDTRLVIALLQSRDWLQLKVLEAQPELTALGGSLADALALQRQHDEVLLQLQSKQSPVEELLRQADQLISTHRPRAEVYAAMAESLGLAWKDVNNHLEQRKNILELNVAYHSHAEECIERMKALEIACKDTNVPVEVDAVKKLLAKLHDLKRVMLEALMVTLQEGKALHEKLKEVAVQGTLDSRPDRIRTSASYSVSQIEHWLEDLHDRRKVLEGSWQSRKLQLEQCLMLAVLAKDLKELEEFLAIRKESLQRSDQLGDSASSAELLLHEHKKLIPEAREFQDRCLKITKATEKLMASGHFAGKQATAQAYIVLNSCAEYFEAVEKREVLLNQAISFFRSSHTALTKLDQIEIQLTTSNNSVSNPNLVQLHSQVTKALEEITAPPLQEGYALLEIVGRSSPGAEGIKRTVEEIENRKINLDSMCIAHKEENILLSKALTTFLERQNELYSWLVSIAEAFLQGHQDMGSVLAMAEDFLQLHHQLLSDLQNKGVEINDVLLTLPPILERLNDEQRTDIDEKVDALHSHWLNLRTLVETRVDLAVLYVKFHTLAVELANEFDAVEEEIKRNTDAVDEDIIRQIEQKWLHIQQLYAQLSSLGKGFMEESAKIEDPYLDVKRASLCVETLLEHFSNRQLVITESWQSWQTNITVTREFQVLWERTMTESNRTLNLVSKLGAQLYPVLTGESTMSKVIVRQLEEKLQLVVPELKKAQTEIELRVKTAENVASKGDSQGEKEAIITKLMEHHSRLNSISTEYQVLIQMLISFFKNLSELEKTIENLQSQYHITRLPYASAEVDLLIKEHEASKQAVLELFKFTQNESEQIIHRINQQEPEKAAKHDVERVNQLLEIKKLAWESAWTDRKLLLEQHYQLCQFDSDLQQINNTLSDLTKQLGAIRGQYGKSLNSAKATSVAFVSFEKTIQLLETRIESFMSTTEHMLKLEYASSHVERELNQLETRWSAFRKQVLESRQLIDLSIEYFTLVEEAEEWFREGSKLLVTIARKSTAVKLPEEAAQLLSEVEMFLKPGEVRQEERIKKISELAVKLYGDEKPKQVTLVVNENKELVDSFIIISEELSTLARNLRTAQDQYEQQKKEQEEVDSLLSAAKAESEAARAAAAAAEEARKAAEAAARVLQEAVPVTEKMVVVEAAVPVLPELERPKKTPSPPLKKAKLIEEVPKPIAPVFTVPLNDATIQEGEQFTFECRVTGFPVPEVVWYKDGISIQNNPDYQTTYDQGICTLAIEETFTEDSARFTCKATNAAGTAETNATLSVKETEPEEPLVSPTFVKRTEAATAKEGSTFQLECTVQGNPLPTVQWYKNDVCIDNSPDYIITYNNGEAILRFEEVFLEDQAEYSCKASNPLGTDMCSAKLSVEPLEPTEAPTFITPLSNVMARAGRKIKLECEVTGLPVPVLTWSQNGKIIKETRDIKLQYENRKATLVINEAFPKDAGTYVVAAKNIAGEATCTCNVSVKGRLPTETSDSELASDLEPIKPSIQLGLKDVSVFEGKQVCLDCIIVGQPEPEVIWYHDSRPVKESSDFQLLFQGDRCSLIIHEAYLEDSGEYKVVAINSGGETFSKCSLTVKSVGDSEPSTRLPVETESEMPQGTPPKFSKLLSDILASQGERVVLECTVSGDPKPDIKWYLNNQEITDVHLKQFNEDADGNVSLAFLEVSPQDKGVYTAKASNRFGEAKCFANLIVKSLPAHETHSPSIMEEKPVAPSFKKLFADRTISENDVTKFECIISGKPKPKVHWCFNDSPVGENEFQISSSGEQHILTIQHVNKSHAGNISCIAENAAGRATCIARLNVVESKDVGDIQSPFQSTSISEKTKSSFVTKQAVFMQSSSQTTASTFISGKGESNVEKHSISSVSEESFQQIGQKPPHQIQSHKIQEIHEVNDEKPDIKQQSFLKISNGGDETQESSTSSYSTPVSSPRPLRKSVAPRFVSPLNGKIVDQGTDVTLEGIIDGYPQPTVTWTKNGQEVKPVDDKISVKYEHNRVELVVKNVIVKDAGQYTCKAVNNVGTSSSTADVVVKKTIFPPVFGRRLQAQTVKVGERLVMEVEITGTPEPTVTWYKDGQKITSADASFRIKTQGNCYALIIEKVSLDHSGQYSVKATNSGGEAQSTADILAFKPEPEVQTVTQTFSKETVESKIEKLSHPQTPATVVTAEEKPPAQATKEKVPSPSPLPPRITPPVIESSVTESRLTTETHTTEKHVSIKVERTPSPMPFRPTVPPKTAQDVRTSTEVKESVVSVSQKIPETIQIPVHEPKPSVPESSTLEVKTEIVKRTSPAPEIVRGIESSMKVEEKTHIVSSTQETWKEINLEFDEGKAKAPSKTFVSEVEKERNIHTDSQKFQIPVEVKSEIHVPFDKKPDPQKVVEIPIAVEEQKVVEIPISLEEQKVAITPDVVQEVKHIEENVVESEESGVESSSVSKKSALEFFMNKLKESEEEKSREMPIKLPPKEIFATPSFPQKEQTTSIKTGTPTSSESFSSDFHSESKSLKFEKQTIYHNDQVSTSSLLEEYNLTPEPPPEMGFVPKSEVIGKYREDVTTRVKKLEETHRVLSPTEIPSGAVRIFPAPVLPEPQVKETVEQIQSSKSPIVSDTIQKEVVEEVCVQKKVSLPGLTDWSIQPVRPSLKPSQPPAVIKEPSTTDVKPVVPQKFVQEAVKPTPPKPEIEPLPPKPTEPVIITDSKIIKETEVFIPSSPIPAPAFVPRPAPSPTPKFHHVPPPEPKVSVPPIAPRPYSEVISVDNQSVSKSELSIHTSLLSSQRTSEIVRSVSPKPSAEGLAMEKLWIPQKPLEPEVIIPKPIVPQSEGDASSKPSAEGLAMDRIWAHKHPDAALKKVWPPPQSTEEKVAIPWSAKGTPEKVWAPPELSSVRKETVEMTSQKTLSEKVSRIESPFPVQDSHESKETLKSEQVIISQRLPSPVPPPPPVPHYIAETRVSHSAAQHESKVVCSKTTTTTISETKEEHHKVSTEHIASKTEREGSPVVVQESVIKPSEAKKIWPPASEDLVEKKPPAISKEVPVLLPAPVLLPVEQPLDTLLEPGQPPEIGYARAPLERRQSYVETVEQTLEKDLEKVPTRHLVGAVRIVPPPPQKKKSDETVGQPSKVDVKAAPGKKPKPVIQSRPFEPFPDLEPFPYKPDSPRARRAPCPPPPKPSKFVKGEFTESDYEYDIDSVRIPPKWRPYESDTEDLSYSRVKPPSFTQPRRPKSTDPEPLPPSRFEKPLHLEGPPRPVIDRPTKEVKSSTKTVSAFSSKTSVQAKPVVQPKSEKVKRVSPQETQKKLSPPALKPGSPPEFVEAVSVTKSSESTTEQKKFETSPPKSKPDSPKSKAKGQRNEFAESGYMADTDEPRQLRQVIHKSTSIKHEETIKTTVEKTTIATEFSQQNIQQSKHEQDTQSQSMVQPRSQSQQHRHHHHQFQTQQKISTYDKGVSAKYPLSKGHHKYSETKSEKKVVMSSGSPAKPKKEVISTIEVRPTPVETVKDDIPSLEPFPFKPDTSCYIKRPVGPPPPSPSKFIKGEFRESDYESDYDSRIRIKWKPADSDADEPAYRPVHPVLASSKHEQSQRSVGRTPTPPTEFDTPPQFSGSPRPKFEPIEKPSKPDEIHKSIVHPPKVFKPKPVTPRTVPPMEVIIATPAVKPIVLEPGSPPEISYAPPPGRGKLPGPFENATQIETSQVMNFAESTERSHRVVNVQQTTRVIKFGERDKGVPSTLEPFPFKAATEQPPLIRPSGPPPTMPRKFVPGDFHESDYESDIESVRIKPKWTPGDSDTEEPHYRRVRPPQMTRSASVPVKQLDKIAAPMEFDSGPVQLRSKTSSEEIISSSTSSQHFKEMRKTFDKTSKVDTRSFLPVDKQIKRKQEVHLEQGPTKFDTAPASQIASKHMSEMTNTFKSKAQQFVSDIMTDVSLTRQTGKPEKPILKPSPTVQEKKEGDEPQAYREESRLAEYGTKHIDPDTGLIYFKYDFGYEFGVILPGEGRKQAEGTPKRVQIDPKRTGDIEVPVIHEKTASESEDGRKAAATQNIAGPNTVPQFRPKKFTHFKAVKWEPASESEMSEAEGDMSQHKKRFSLPQPSPSVQKEPHIHIPASSHWEQASPSPLSLSLSPSLPSLSPHSHGATLDSAVSPGGSWQGLSPLKSPRAGQGRGNTPTPPSTPSTPGSTPAPGTHQLRKPPMFITPLRDIAVVNGQTARFECIVQAEPPPNILWSKNGRILENSENNQIHYRNGVCRLTILKATAEDEGTYTCTATNLLGTIGTSALLQVPGERRSAYK